MKKIVLLVLCALFLSFCSLPQRATESFGGWSNNTVDSLLFFNDTVSSYQLKPKYQRAVVPFSVKEREMQPKGETYGYDMNSIDGRYYTVAEHKDRYGHDYKLIIYNIRGDNDMEILVSQMNSYKQGTLIDALVLEMNFTFETKCSACYTINDSVVKIDRYEINGILYAEDGDIIGAKAVPDTVIYHSVYKIEDGQFIMSSTQQVK